MMGWQLWIWIKSFRKKKKHVNVSYRQTVSLRRETGDCWICERHIVRVNAVSFLSHQIQTRVMSNISLLFIFFSPWTNKFTWNLTRSKNVWGKLLVVQTLILVFFLLNKQPLSLCSPLTQTRAVAKTGKRFGKFWRTKLFSVLDIYQGLIGKSPFHFEWVLEFRHQASNAVN